MNLFVEGFLFNEDYSKVALIRKNRPEWQAGLLNGIGGKIEVAEFPINAMHREFFEEAGVKIDNFRQFLTLHSSDFHISFYTAVGDLDSLKSMTDEIIEIHNVNDVPNLPVIPNLKWIIPMACDVKRPGGILHEYSY